MGTVAYLVVRDGMTLFFPEHYFRLHYQYDPDDMVERIVYFEVEDD